MPDYSKNKVLALLKYLQKYSDEKHPVTMKQIQGHMEAKGYPYSRATAVRNIKQLREELGIDIISTRGKNAGYYVGNRLFENEELKTMIDSINASNFIEKDIAKKMSDKLKSLISIYEAEDLERNILGVSVAKTGNKKILYIVNTIQEAINKNVQIRFTNRNWDIDKELKKTRDQKNTLNPWTLIWADDRYYLYGYDVNESLSERHYRVDKIDEIELLDVPRKGKQKFESFDATTYVSRRIGMFSGEEKRIIVETERKLVGAFIDQFGRYIIISPIGEGDKVEISFYAVKSNNLYGWLIGLGKVEVISPQSVRKEMESLIQQNLNYYQKV